MVKAIFRTIFVASVFVLLVGAVRAVDLNISGNAADSQNTIQIQQSGSTTVNQSNQMDVNNDVDAQANTGGNSTGDGGGSVTTGDASIFVKIKNLFNINQAETGCCPTPTPKVTPYDPGDPTPTEPGDEPPAEDQNGDGEPDESADGNGGEEDGVGGGEVLGLSATAGNGLDATVIQLLGLVCLGIGSALVGPKKLFT